jgi:regulator of cell morphogenesis and NO signaling
MKAGKRTEIINFNDISLERLIEYISNTHHKYLKETILTLKVHLKTMLKIDSLAHPEVKKISDNIDGLKLLLEQHLVMEEHILFPYLKTISKKEDMQSNGPASLSGSLILKIKKEHSKINAIIKEIRKLSDNYTPAINSSPALKLCYARMFDLEQDLHRHIFTEERILFPKLLEFENRLINNLNR